MYGESNSIRFHFDCYGDETHSHAYIKCFLHVQVLDSHCHFVSHC